MFGGMKSRSGESRATTRRKAAGFGDNIVGFHRSGSRRIVGLFYPAPHISATHVFAYLARNSINNSQYLIGKVSKILRLFHTDTARIMRGVITILVDATR
tara:strand:- start:167828 stop:168127 length:300 start_codon:yes stop_codon:yes gene_type:complete